MKRECSFMVISQQVQEVYMWYKQDLLTVDRAYQRKLVWTLTEKRFLIDTLLKNYPIPMIMLIGGSPRETKQPASVMDGLQRLEAIFAFIDNKYGIMYEGKEHFFNLDCYPGYGIKVRNKELEQRQPVLDAELCNSLLQYQLPVSFIDANSTVVENVFKRINSTGRALSPQCLRQSGITSKFSSIVQDIASNIRGDYTAEQIVNFKEMENISLSSPGLTYGVDTKQLFWIKNEIINDDAIRRSKDEEIIANLLNCLMNGPEVGTSRDALNTIYDETKDTYKKNEEKLSDVSNRNYYTDLLLQVFEAFQQAAAASPKTLAELICGKSFAYNKDWVFIVLFLAVARLYQEQYIVEDIHRFVQVLDRIAVRYMSDLVEDNCKWNRFVREEKIAMITPHLRACMTQKTFDPKWNNEVIDLLQRAQVESQLFDFKIGTCTFSSKPIKDNMRGVIEQCIYTLIAMANSNPAKKCCVVIGVADKQKDAEEYTEALGATYSKCNNTYITGIEAESVKLHKSVDYYIMDVRKCIASFEGEFSKEVITSILTSLKPVHYNNHTLLTMTFCTNKPIIYNNNITPIRVGNSNKKLIFESPNEMYDFFTDFNRKLAEAQGQTTKPDNGGKTSIFS